MENLLKSVDIFGKKSIIFLVVAGFGTFKITERSARDGRNPLTGEKIKIKASKSVNFKVSTNLKKILN